MTRGHLEYRGRISRQAFTAWCAGRDGRKAIDRVAAGIRFSIVGRGRSARRRLWRNLETVTRTAAFAQAASAEPASFLRILAAACYADALPRVHVNARRLVLVPRALLAGRARADVLARLLRSPALAGLDDDLRVFVLEHMVSEMDAALRAASLSPRRPVSAHDGWACVGARLGTVWLDPLWAGPNGTGHLFMYEMPPQGLSRRDARAIESAMEQVSEAAAGLSRNARDVILRSASARHA